MKRTQLLKKYDWLGQFAKTLEPCTNFTDGAVISDAADFSKIKDPTARVILRYDTGNDESFARAPRRSGTDKTPLAAIARSASEEVGKITHVAIVTGRLLQVFVAPHGDYRSSIEQAAFVAT